MYTLRMPNELYVDPARVIPTSGERGEVSHTITLTRPIVIHPYVAERAFWYQPWHSDFQKVTQLTCFGKLRDVAVDAAWTKRNIVTATGLNVTPRLPAS